MATCAENHHDLVSKKDLIGVPCIIKCDLLWYGPGAKLTCYTVV